MNNPFDNVPSSADVQETTDKKTHFSLSSLVERFEVAVSRNERAIKNQEELAGAVFETFLDDDGWMKDLSHSVEIKSILHQTEIRMEAMLGRAENTAKEIPSTIEAQLCEEDRNRLDTNFIRLKNLIKLHLPIVISIGALVGICLMGSVMVSNSASDKRHYYEQRIKKLDRWHQENAEAISFGQFYRENYPKKYHEWQTGCWQQDIAFRDSVIRAHSLDRLKRLHED